MIRGRPSKFSLKGNVGQAFVGDVDPIQAVLNQFTFLAELKTNVLLQRGAGAASYTRATVATVKDFEGNKRVVLSGEVRFEGQRRVRNWNNQATSSENITSYTAVNGATIQSATQFTCVNTNSYIQGAASGLKTTGIFVWSAVISATGGNRNLGVRLTDNSDGSDATDTTLAVTSTPTRYSIRKDLSASATFSGNLAWLVGGVGVAVTAGSVFTITNVQVEEVTGQSNQNPSEYVSVGAAKLNMLLQTEAYTTSPWVSSLSTLAQNGTLGGVVAWDVTDSSAVAYSNTAQTITVPNDASSYTLAVRVKKTTGGTAPVFGINFGLSGGVGVSVTSRINTDLGTQAYASDARNTINDRGSYWEIVSTITNNTSGNTALGVTLYPATAAAGGVADAVAATGTQTIAAPVLVVGSTRADYFPVGNVYPYHGACVDGVKYFATQNGNTVASNVVTEATGASVEGVLAKYLYLPGVAGNYASTPDSAANSITGDIDIRARVAPADWTPAAAQAIVGKDSGATTANRSYLFYLNTDGTLHLLWSTNGQDAGSFDKASTVATGFTDGDSRWVRAVLDVNNGAAGNDVKFYTAADSATEPTSWTQLGTTVTTAGNTSIFDGNGVLDIGARTSSGTLQFSGKIYRASIYSTIGGTTPVVDFNASDATDGAASFVSQTTGETWTINGTGARLTWQSNTIKGFQIEEARTNLVLQSSNFGTTWTAVGTPTRSAAAKYCGDIALDLIGDDDAGVAEGYYQNITFTGDAVKSISFLVKQGSATSSSIIFYDATAVANRAAATLSWSGGVPSLSFVTGTQERAPEACGDGVYRVFIATTSVTAANTNRLIIYPASDAGAAVALTGTIYIGGVQAENATFASTHVPTTTGTATRDADAMSYPGAGNVSATAGTVYAEVLFDKSAGAQQTICDISDGTANERITLHRSSAGNITVDVVDGGVSQASLNLGALANGTVGKIAFRYAANDIAGSLNGAAVVSDTSATLPTVTTIYPGSQAATVQASSPVGPVMIAQRKLSDAELITVTR